MVDLDEKKGRIRDVIEAHAAELEAVSLGIHGRPELNFHEYHAHDLLAGFLENKGFMVARGAYEMPTAFCAVAGSGSPTIAVLCEYDALPEIGHACGHNLIAASGVAAGLALKDALGEGNGTIIVLGSPAEEGGGGKVLMVEQGAFDGVDAAMMLHPSPNDGAWPSVNAIQTLDVEYFGRNAHAAARPHEGINALDAMVAAYNAISMLRQQMTPDARVHGVITKGGVKPNIIPDHTAAEFYIRAADDAKLEDLKRRVLACFEGAATATGCRLEVRWTGRPYSNLTTNNPMAESYVENARLLGKSIPPRGAGAGGGPSTDMGNVSHVVPSIHPMFAIPTEAGNHTPGFTAAAATAEAHQAMRTAATALAMTALDLYLRPDLLKAARADFEVAHADRAPVKQEV
jgi:amidohydrolase